MRFELVEYDDGPLKCPVCVGSIPDGEYLYQVERSPEADEVTDRQRKWLKRITDDDRDEFDFFMCEECGESEGKDLRISKGYIDGKNPISYLDGDKWLERKIEEYKKS